MRLEGQPPPSPPPRYILLYIFMSALFQDQVLFFLHVSFWKNEYYVLDNISPKGLEKTFIDFSNDTFLLGIIGIIKIIDRYYKLSSLYMGNLIYKNP